MDSDRAVGSVGSSGSEQAMGLIAATASDRMVGADRVVGSDHGSTHKSEIRRSFGADECMGPRRRDLRIRASCRALCCGGRPAELATSVVTGELHDGSELSYRQLSATPFRMSPNNTLQRA